MSAPHPPALPPVQPLPPGQPFPSGQPFPPAVRPMTRARRVWRGIASVLCWLGGVAGVGSASMLVLGQGVPGGPDFDIWLVLVLAFFGAGLFLLVALIIGLAARMRTWWVPLLIGAVMATGVLAIRAELPEQFIWPAYRAQLEASNGQCPNRLGPFNRVQVCRELAGGTAYVLDNGFLNTNALLRLPEGVAPPPTVAGQGVWRTAEDLGDGWYFITQEW